MSNTAKRVRASKLKPKERKQRLLSVAVDVFASKGIGTVKHVDVAKAAGVAAPTVFSYFPSREVLIQQVLDEVGNYVVQSVVDIAPQEKDLEERLYQSGLKSIALIDERPNIMRVWLMWGTNFVPELQAQYQHYETQILDTFCEIIRSGSATNDPEEDIHDRARMIMGSSTYLQKMIFEGVNEQRQEAFVRHIVSFAKI
ncbi:MAG: TetR/AcrR family transcriptional regulator [Pseudomonadales bacterium]